MAFIFLPSTLGVAVTLTSIARSTWLPTTSVTICAPPRYGTWVMNTLPWSLISSIARCSTVPMPDVA